MEAEDKLFAHAECGDRISALLDDPAVARFFEAQISELTKVMLGAKIEDDTTRRSAAVKIALVHDLRKHLENCVVRGDRARREISKTRTMTNG